MRQKSLTKEAALEMVLFILGNPCNYEELMSEEVTGKAPIPCILEKDHQAQWYSTADRRGVLPSSICQCLGCQQSILPGFRLSVWCH